MKRDDLPPDERRSHAGDTAPPEDRSPSKAPNAENEGTGLDLSILPPEIDPAILVDEFVSSCREHLQQAEAALLALESNPESDEAVNTVFRAFHTIKGSSAFLGLGLVSELAHRAENLLSRIREKEIACTGVHAELALRCVDALRSMIDRIPAALHGARIEKPDDYNALIMSLSISGVGDEEAAAEAPPPTADPSFSSRPPQGSPAAIEASVRVRTDRLDQLIDAVGELVIAHSMVAQDRCAIPNGDQEFVRKLTELGRIVRDLQRISMSMRMVPLRPTFLKAARQVRDLAKRSRRLVTFVSDGAETEIDRHMVDAISDPLIHMIRNAVDHGIEPPELRAKAGKPRAGRLELSAFHSGGHVVIRLADDGAGLDRRRLAERARARGLIEAERELSDSELLDLIFEPGFSTSEEVTDLSGRGVGMDVVRRVVRQLQGTIETESEKGIGTTFTLHLPLTMAVTDGMLVGVGHERFILPTTSIQTTFRPDPSSIATYAGQGEMVTVLGEVLPIVRLHHLFGLSGAVEDPTRAILVVIDGGRRRRVLMVDELLGQQQVVAKPVPGGFGRRGGIVGGAILGDGRVGLILDPAQILKRARENPVEKDAGRTERLVDAGRSTVRQGG